MTYRVKNITIAVALALVAALLTSFYVTNYQRNVKADETNVQVFVAKNDIPVGTSGADLARKGLLEKSEIAPGTTVRRTISDFSSRPFRARSAPEVPTGMSFFATKT